MGYRRDSRGQEICEPLAEDPRHYDSNSGDPKQDGYALLCRRPRVRGFEECLPVDEADRIEGIFDDLGAPMSGSMPGRGRY